MPRAEKRHGCAALAHTCAGARRAAGAPAGCCVVAKLRRILVRYVRELGLSLLILSPVVRPRGFFLLLAQRDGKRAISTPTIAARN